MHATADGVLLAFHDAVLDRVTDRSGAIAELPVRRSRRGPDPWHRPHPARWPTCSTAFPDARFNIDAKSDDRGRPAGRRDRRARGVRPGLRQLVRRPAGCTGCGAARVRGSPPPPAPLGVAVNRFLPWLTGA